MLRRTILLVVFAAVAHAAGDTVQVDFYGEALCPYCEKFLTKDLSALYDSGFLSKYVEFRYIPYGNAKVVDGQVCARYGLPPNSRKLPEIPVDVAARSGVCPPHPTLRCPVHTKVPPPPQTVCQHGPVECQGNVLLNCVMHLYPALDQWYPFARCVESEKDILGVFVVGVFLYTSFLHFAVSLYVVQCMYPTRNPTRLLHLVPSSMEWTC